MLISASACPLSHHQGIVKPPQSLEAPLPLCGYSQIYDLIKKGWFLVIPSFSRKFICLRFSKPDTAYKGHGGSNYRHCQTSSSFIHCIEEPPIVCQSSIALDRPKVHCCFQTFYPHSQCVVHSGFVLFVLVLLQFQPPLPPLWSRGLILIHLSSTPPSCPF